MKSTSNVQSIYPMNRVVHLLLVYSLMDFCFSTFGHYCKILISISTAFLTSSYFFLPQFFDSSFPLPEFSFLIFIFLIQPIRFVSSEGAAFRSQSCRKCQKTVCFVFKASCVISILKSFPIIVRKSLHIISKHMTENLDVLNV